MPLLVVLALLIVPIAEIYVIVQVGQEIGAGWTILLLIADAVLGSWLIRREGRRAWLALREKVNSGGLPAKELADGALILIGGTLLLTPGFLSDILGFFFVLPFTRPLARRGLIAFAKRYFVVVGPGRPTGPGGFGPGGPFGGFDGFPGPGGRGPGGGPGRRPGDGRGDVIPGEIVDE
ncbi:FxsA family protein [Sporichthya polymorpha]|uniref:FxsA family protein n=1 Tax=Sporichthya polymorpha TaxID=35751 RepID=UPI00037A213E|nr:FxsA family protein [Sporichthya polymorpha]